MIPAALLLLWNTVTFFVTFYDKHAAARQRRRIPERRFRLFAALFGGVGVLSAFYIFRHKTRHTGLLISVWTLTLLSIGVLAAAWYFANYRLPA